MSENEVQEVIQKNDNEAKMDAIKQLIFGENMVEYDQRFNAMMEQMQKSQQLLESKIQEVDATLNSTISTLESTINDAIYDLNGEFESKTAKMEDSFNVAFDKLDNKKTDRRTLGKMLQTIGEKLQK